MNWLNIELKTLRSIEFLGSDPIQRATWLCLMAYCADQENGGRIKDVSKWMVDRWRGFGVIKREYFYNRPSLQMVMAQTLHFYDVVFGNISGLQQIENRNLSFTSSTGLTAGDIIYVSKRDSTQNSQLNRFLTISGTSFSST